MMQRPVLIRIFGLVVGVGLSAGAGLGQVALASEAALRAPIAVVWTHSGNPLQQTLHAFTDAQLKALAPRGSRGSGKQGPLLSSVLDAAMKDLSAESKSQIDLVVLHGEAGAQAWIPRALVTRSSLVLALPERDSVIPAGAQSRLQAEELPFKTYSMKGVQRVELTNYRERFEKFYLKRRTDPAAMRGEKVFIQNCMACHSQLGKTPSVPEEAFSAQLRKHPKAEGYLGLSPKTERALLSYWTAYRLEQGPPSLEKNPEKR